MKPQVQSVLQTLGYRAGKGTLELKLPAIPRRVISAALQALKTEHEACEDKRFAENRVHIQVLARGVLLAQDSTHVGYCQGRRVWAEVCKDVASTWAWADGDGSCFTGGHMMGHLEGLWNEGLLPLVLATDNGAPYKDYWVGQALQKEQVIHLFSRPHTPQDNAWAERGIGEGKALAGLDGQSHLQSPIQGVQKLNEALQTLNEHWPRQSRGGLTAAQLEKKLPHWADLVQRERFYAAAEAAISDIPAKPNGTNQRTAKREAIFRTLEQFGLILRTRGDRKGP